MSLPAHPRRASTLLTGALCAACALLDVAPSSQRPQRTGARRAPVSVRAASVRARTALALAYSRASASVVQRQPAPHSCHARGSGLYELPDPRCTPGALNPAVTQSNIHSTICSPGWTATVRPSEAITEQEKYASMRAYADSGGAGGYEYDHLVPLELGGAVNDARNLWPEPDYASRQGYYLNPKDRLEQVLNHLVCDQRMSLYSAQRMIAEDWVHAYRTYG